MVSRALLRSSNALGGGVQVPRWRTYMVLDPMSMCAGGCGPFEGLLHKPSA